MLWKLLSSIFTVVVFLINGSYSKRVTWRVQSDKVVVCYVGTWATYRPNEGQFQFGAGDLDPAQCTHLIYSFSGLDNQTWNIKSLDPYLDLKENYGRDGYRNMTSLRYRYNGIKITLAIGGWNEGSEKYSALAANSGYRNRFVNSVVKFLKEYGFDGLDLDWEFPGKRHGNPEKDKENFVLLVKDLSMELKKKGMLLTTAISADKDTIDLAYNIPELSKYLDYIHVMAYDYHGAWDRKVLPNAPLHCKTDSLCVEETVKHLLKRGAQAEKLVLGLPFYGRTFILSSIPTDTKQNPIGLASSDTGFDGPFTKEKGFMGYNEICRELLHNRQHWRSGWDENSKTPYAINGDKVVVYDDPKSILSKVAFADEMGFAGVMIWSIDTDDFRGDCGALHHDYLDPLKGLNFPLMRIINQALGEEEGAGGNYISSTRTPQHDHHHHHHNSSTVVVNYSLILLAITSVILFKF